MRSVHLARGYGQFIDIGSAAIFLQHDPLAEKYYNLSPYAHCANNPVNFVDPDGRSTWVTENAAGTYNVVGGNQNDNDLNIYIVTYDEDGNVKIGDPIGTTVSMTTFYNTDKDDGAGGWMIGSIIDPMDQSGINFINNIQQQYLTLLQYIWNARTDKPYDFKVTNGQGGMALFIHLQGMWGILLQGM